jgi:hypothetical protein
MIACLTVSDGRVNPCLSKRIFRSLVSYYRGPINILVSARLFQTVKGQAGCSCLVLIIFLSTLISPFLSSSTLVPPPAVVGRHPLHLVRDRPFTARFANIPTTTPPTLCAASEPRSFILPFHPTTLPLLRLCLYYHPWPMCTCYEISMDCSQSRSLS